MASFIWREAPGIFTVLHETYKKKSKLTVERENREEIHQKQGKDR